MNLEDMPTEELEAKLAETLEQKDALVKVARTIKVILTHRREQAMWAERFSNTKKNRLTHAMESDDTFEVKSIESTSRV